MKNTDLTTANYDALKTYVLELRDRVMNKEYIKPIAESLANRNDLTLFQKCSIMDLIAEQSEISFAHHPALAAPKRMPLLVKGIMGYRVGTDEANSGKLKNSIPAWCEEQKAIFKATPQQITVTDPDRHPADSVPAVPDKKMNKRNRNVKPKVNADGLRKYFTLPFQNSGKFNYLVGDLADLRTVKDCATVAGMVYDMGKSNYIKTHSTFAAWCRAFFANIAVSVPVGYNFSKRPQPTDELKRKFYYLE